MKTQFWSLKNFELQCGIRLPQVTLAYATYGKLSPQRCGVPRNAPSCKINRRHWLY